MLEPEFLKDIYHEAGEQIRNINNLRNTYRGFFIVAVGAIVALISRDSSPLPDKGLWLSIFAFSVIGAVMVWLTKDYVNTSLQRQQDIISIGLTEESRNQLHYKPKHFDPLATMSIKDLLSRDRLHIFEFGVYIFFGITTLVFALEGDPFGLTT